MRKPTANAECGMMNDERSENPHAFVFPFIIHHSSFIISPSVSPCLRGASSARRRGFTLIEILVAMAVTLIMLGLVITIFALVTDNVSGARATMEMSDQLRACKHRLQLDLAGITVQMLPPRNPEFDEGYFEYIEGPVGRLWPNTKQVRNELYDPKKTVQVKEAIGPDTTVGDNDDIVMFTTRSRGEPFVGKCASLASGTAQSQVAEVAWFLRGTTLYRRQLLVLPNPGPPNYGTLVTSPAAAYSFYANFDVSARTVGAGYELGPSPTPNTVRIVANSLGDLTKRENRFAHAYLFNSSSDFPHDVRGWGTFFADVTNTPLASIYTNPFATYGRLGLPTLRECSSASSPLTWPLPGLRMPNWKPVGSGQSYPLTVPKPNGQPPGGDSSGNPAPEPFDAWNLQDDAWEFDPTSNPPNQPRRRNPPLARQGPNPWNEVDPATGNLMDYLGPRISDDIILTNVLAFDVRVWDPRAPLLLDATGNLCAPGDPGYAQAFTNWTSSGSAPDYQTALLKGRGAYVDLNYANQTGISSFSGPGELKSGLRGGLYIASVYDTWSTHYEQDGIDQNGNGVVDEGTDGFDNDNNGLVDEYPEPFVDSNGNGQWDGGMNPEPYTDLNGNGKYDPGEHETEPPYRVPLRGVQIKIRCFEPDSRQIREVTIVQEFVPE